MKTPELTTVETCKYISDIAVELSRLADAAGADRLSSLLAEVVEQAEALSRKHRDMADTAPAEPRA